jgi:predicted RND superfamily exporter protein
MPIIMAGATTAAGFIAQFTSPLEPFRTFGLLSAVGVCSPK